ncbi:MAG: hypothetical protein WC868_07715 [Bacteroidales bacterium]
MNIKTDIEIQEKINDCILNKSKYVEWLCQNKTERQMKQLLQRMEKIYEFAVQNKINKHIELVDLWKDQVNTALKNFSNYENLYAILKKMKKNKKTTSYERMFVDKNYDWFYNRIWGLTEEEIKILEHN